MTAQENPAWRKTPLGGRFTRQLIRVNDQLCFAALQQSEFLKQLEPLAQARGKEFTTDVFPDNPYAETIHRRLDDIKQFSKEAEQIALQMGIIAAVEYVLVYMDEVTRLRETLHPQAGPHIHHEAEEEKLRLKVERWSTSVGRTNAVKVDYFRTLGYFRLLRNHYAHVNEAPSHAFSDHIRLQGTLLNSFWKKQITDVRGIDFKTLAKKDLTPDLAFGVMNLLRVCVQLIDQMVANTLLLTEVIEWTVREIWIDAKNRKLSTERFSSKVATRLRMDWNVVVSASGITAQVQQAVANVP